MSDFSYPMSINDDDGTWINAPDLKTCHLKS